MDQFDAMRIFSTVATQQSFAGAARKLRLSPSVVTRAVAQIEEQLGLTLLNRTTRAVQLTERGAMYLEDCRRILQDVEDAGRRARGEDAAPRGILNIAAPILFGRLHVLPVINQILRDYPDLSVRLSLSDRNVHLIEEGIDIAVRIGALEDSALMAVKLGTVRRVLAASPAYLAARGVPDNPGALAIHDLIAFESLDATNEWRFGEEGKAIRIEPRLMVNSADAAIAAAEAGVGIARAFSYQVRAAILAGRLMQVLQDLAPPPVPVQAVYQVRGVASPNVALFLKQLRAHVSPALSQP